MEDKYVYLIVAIIVIGAIVLAAIYRYSSLKGKIKLPGGINVEGEGSTGAVQCPKTKPQGSTNGASARTKVRGNVEGHSRVETTTDSGPAIVEINGSVKNGAIIKTTKR